MELCGENLDLSIHQHESVLPDRSTERDPSPECGRHSLADVPSSSYIPLTSSIEAFNPDTFLHVFFSPKSRISIVNRLIFVEFHEILMPS